MPSTLLDDRAVVQLEGPEARALLDRLVTCEVATVSAGEGRYGALLTPQGKILGDFILFPGPGPDAFHLDAATACAAELVKRINLYRLRAKVVVRDVSEAFGIRVGWGEAAPPKAAVATVTDPRLPALGWRAVVPRDAAGAGEGATPGAYHAHRVAQGVPEIVRDFAPGDAFLHEALMDQLGGVDFRKGCYVGQEVVSRMQHRGTARTRVVRLRYGEAGPHPMTEVTGGERPLGRASEAAGEIGLALVRLDRAADALASGAPILAGDKPVRFDKPGWVRFPYPGETVENAA